MGKALGLLKEGLKPYVERELRSMLYDRSLRRVRGI